MSTKQHCNECNQRAVAGPNYDPIRRTGRTSRALYRALASALGGHRVLFVCATHEQAKELTKQAREIMIEAQVSPDSTTATRINMFNGGWLELRGMQSDLEYRGIVAHRRPSITVWDHYALELGERDRKLKEKHADQAVIHNLLKKHGYSEAVIDARVVGGCKFIVDRS